MGSAIELSSPAIVGTNPLGKGVEFCWATWAKYVGVNIISFLRNILALFEAFDSNKID